MAFTAELLRRCCHSLVFTPEVSLTHWTHQSPQILVAETGTNRKDKSGTLLKTNFNNYVLGANPGLFSGGGAPMPPLKNEFNLVSWFILEGGAHLLHLSPRPALDVNGHMAKERCTSSAITSFRATYVEILKPISQESERKSTLPCRPQSFVQSSH